ncbi:hypothetical protein HRW14_13620 [Streptomyces lunaelactis]|uniref:hypothetical protein n=1 Tax=Streptomyces lunaelactis TaxID=1535768 RepID=UPI001585CDF8|nr:hypothetical protein [Streptomyces lunaelactis]NUK51291.1 hypothetical protein [Streptomyces lunaelactis]NUK56822.1 hypothetical protein [Streptomyces lunaelactis]
MATLLSARSRLTVFHLEGLTVAYTTQSSDSRGLGDIAVVTVVAPDSSTGDHLWRLAASMFTNPPPGQTQARWILTQCTRARAVKAPAYRDLPDAKWAADLTRELHLDALFANHTILRTGRLTIE